TNALNNTLEWGTPVLYMRSPNGVLFTIKNRIPRKTPQIDETLSLNQISKYPPTSEQRQPDEHPLAQSPKNSLLEEKGIELPGSVVQQGGVIDTVINHKGVSLGEDNVAKASDGNTTNLKEDVKTADKPPRPKESKNNDRSIINMEKIFRGSFIRFFIFGIPASIFFGVAVAIGYGSVADFFGYSSFPLFVLAGYQLIAMGVSRIRKPSEH
ncbi:MAG: hypothetical protein R3A44_42740, partial [Caldilineaceae bacterium]